MPDSADAGEPRTSAPTVVGARDWRGSIGWLGGAVLGLVLLVAAGLKALDPAGFGEEIARQNVALGLPLELATLAALLVEVGLGAALLLNLRRLPVMIAATLLVVFFLVLTGRGAWREAHGVVDDSGSCGCFGALVDRTPREAFVQDLWLLLPPLAFAWVGRPGARSGVVPRVAIAAGLAGATAALALAAPRLDVDDWATRLRPGVAIADLCVGRDEKRVCLPSVAPELASGRHLVVLAAIEDPGFDALAKRLNAYAHSGQEPPLTVLADLTLEQRQAMYWRLRPAFVLHETPRALLRPLYRRLPRSFRLDDGRVTATWRELPETIPATPETD